VTLEQVTDTNNSVRGKILHTKILEYLGAILFVIQGCESILQVVRQCNRRKTTNVARSDASDSSGGRIISVPSSRHSMESGSRCDKCAALRGAVVDAPAPRSVQVHGVRRSGAR
jgi:hypothetical protein